MMTDNRRKALLIMAHGSRKAEANQEFLQLVDSIAHQAHEYIIVKGCFLELAEPNLTVAIQQCIADELTTIDVYPLFFNQGNHVMRDIPAQIARAQETYPTCNIQQLSYFGQFTDLGRCILQHISQQV